MPILMITVLTVLGATAAVRIIVGINHYGGHHEKQHIRID